MELKKIHISDIGKVVTGKTPRTSVAENYGGDIPFLTPSDNLSHKSAPKTIKTLTKQGLNEVKNCLLPPQSVCVSCIGSDLGKVVMTVEPTVTNQQFNSIVPNENFNADFVYYLMSQVGKELNYLSKTSTAVPIINKSSFSNYEVEVPSLKVQEKIASILASLDSKIELNRRINDNLEQQAQALFAEVFESDHTFTQLGAVIETCSGGTPSRNNLDYYIDGTICWVKSKELNRSFLFDTEEKIAQVGIDRSSAKLLPKNSVLIAMYGATVGEYCIIDKPMTCNQAICALLPSSDYPASYLYMFIKQKRNELINLAVGSAQQYFSQVLIKGLCVSDNLKLIAKFDKMVMPIFNMIRKNVKESIILEAERNTLLPRLMSGELKINDLNC